MLTVGDKLPSFDLLAVDSDSELAAQPDQAFKRVNQDSFPDKWKVLFFWPKDFTFVCPTEIRGYGDLLEAFNERDTQLIGASTDGEFVHLAWRRDHQDLKGLSFPWLADIKRELASALGILDRREGVALRATFIVDPANLIRHVSVNDHSVGRNPQETLRLLDALQSDELCPCNWHKGEPTIRF
ncbi:peroxiredoxin [Metapseudomonas boanensis]|uniref:Alkyl hydroperoxide reductase C n=1 Tax=Metapseudomonas boanensis TaxID=2822138 RepID=A0ABS5XDX5_9GAMM|nr:peroxiredoxin [Pseudomonas boanensis]MBT8765275.1 peroxiredoxin [Pseudomonas boanensis]